MTTLLIEIPIEPSATTCEGCTYYRIHNDYHMCIAEVLDTCILNGNKRSKACLAAQKQAEPLIKVSRVMDILSEVEAKYPHALWRNGVFGLIRSSIKQGAK